MVISECFSIVNISSLRNGKYNILQAVQEKTMNDIQHEQLFTDLTHTQAETVAAGVSTRIDTPYGGARADITRTGPGSFVAAELAVADLKIDGSRVYAKFRAKATDGTILTTPTRRYDTFVPLNQATVYKGLRGSFSKNIKQIQLAVYKDQPGTDPVSFGDWVNI